MVHIWNWIKGNKAGLSLVAIAAAVLIGLTACAGWQLSDFVSVKVPVEVQKATGAPAKTSLTDAPKWMKRYVEAGDEFNLNIDAGNTNLGWLSAGLDIGVRYGAANIPFGGAAIATLFGVGGLLTKGPGTQKEKEKSYAKGKTDAEALFLPLLAQAGVTIPDADPDA